HDPSNHSAHRFLSDAYLNIPRHEIARVSELLQAQLLQPINVNPVQPRLAVADLNIITGTSPSVTGFNEFSPLMERNRLQLVASGIVGSNSTLGDEVVASALFDRASISVGQFHYDTKGFRSNNDQTHNIYNAFVQYAVTPKFNVQAEFRRRESEHGDLLIDFNSNPKNPRLSLDYNRRVQENIARVGGRYVISPQQDLLISAKYIDRSERTDRSQFIRTHLDNIGFQVEAQYHLRSKYFNSVIGGGAYEFDWKERGKKINNISRENFYTYTNANWKNFNATLGLSYDMFTSSIDGKRDGLLNPKFGLQWNLSDHLRLRAAWFETTKSHLLAQQSLEPTHIVGFNQFFDDTNGTRSRRMGMALDVNLQANLYGGVEVSERKLRVPYPASFAGREFLQNQKEQLFRSYLYWSPHSYWTVKGEFQYETFLRSISSMNRIDEPTKIRTLKSPLSLDFFHPTGFFSKFIVTFVEQNLVRAQDELNKISEIQYEQAPKRTNSGLSSFFLIDSYIGFRLPNRRGIISFEGRNLLDKNFYFRSVNFQESEAVPPSFLPERTFFLRLTLNV
ncbi:MAG: TonB-dependent receptor, partial [Candidatus Brocadia sp. WS118]